MCTVGVRYSKSQQGVALFTVGEAETSTTALFIEIFHLLLSHRYSNFFSIEFKNFFFLFTFHSYFFTSKTQILYALKKISRWMELLLMKWMESTRAAPQVLDTTQFSMTQPHPRPCWRKPAFSQARSRNVPVCQRMSISVSASWVSCACKQVAPLLIREVHALRTVLLFLLQ